MRSRSSANAVSAFFIITLRRSIRETGSACLNVCVHARGPLPSVTSPRRLSFSSSRAEKNFSILFCHIWVQGKQPWPTQKQRMRWFLLLSYSLPPPLALIEIFPPPWCLSAALWRNPRGVQKHPSPVCCPHSPQDSVRAKITVHRCQPCAQSVRLFQQVSISTQKHKTSEGKEVNNVPAFTT